MSRTPYKRKQGDLELRILPDGRLVMVAPDETLMEIARVFETKTDEGQQHLENQNAETSTPGSE